MNDIEKAFGQLNVSPDVFVKAKKGEKKVGNPRYRKTIKDGKTVYVLVNKEEHPSQDKKIDEENFDRLQQNGRVERQYDEVPVIRSLSQLRHIDWIPEKGVGVIERAISRIAFFEESIKFAEATGNSLMAKGHRAGQATEINNIDNTVKRAFDGKNFEGFDHNDIDMLNSMGVSTNTPTDDAFDYMNNVLTGFNVVALAKGIKEAISRQQDKLEKIGVDPSEWSPKIRMNFSSSSLQIRCENPSNIVTDKFGYKCNLQTSMSRNISGSSNKTVSHSIFTLGKVGTTADNEKNPLRQGFAKDIMQSFNEQYKNGGLDTISVSAAGASYGGAPYCGSNTWGRWGFKTSKSSALNLVENAKREFSAPKKKLVDEFFVEHKHKDSVAKYKKNENGAVSKVVFESGTEIVEGREVTTKVITKKSDDGKYSSKVTITKTINLDDAKRMGEVVKDYIDKNPNEPNFRLKEIYNKMDGSIVRGLLQDQGWNGSVDLNDEGNKSDFESNLHKRYYEVTDKDIEIFEKESK